MYSILGYVSVGLLVLLVLPYVLRIINTKFLKRNKRVNNVIKFLKKYHKLFGAAALIISLIHGYMALGGLRLHTGSLVFMSMALAAITGMLFAKKKKKILLTLHRAFSALSIALLGLHYFFPSALYYMGL